MPSTPGLSNYLSGIDERGKEIDILKSEIDKSNRAKTDFLNNMSHEIRTPMNTIFNGYDENIHHGYMYDYYQTPLIHHFSMN